MGSIFSCSTNFVLGHVDVAPVVRSQSGTRELIAHFAAKRLGLCELNMVGVRRLAPAHDARLSSNEGRGFLWRIAGFENAGLACGTKSRASPLALPG